MLFIPIAKPLFWIKLTNAEREYSTILVTFGTTF
jgi:hypothetical protein